MAASTELLEFKCFIFRSKSSNFHYHMALKGRKKKSFLNRYKMSFFSQKGISPKFSQLRTWCCSRSWSAKDSSWKTTANSYNTGGNYWNHSKTKISFRWTKIDESKNQGYHKSGITFLKWFEYLLLLFFKILVHFKVNLDWSSQNWKHIDDRYILCT